MITSLHTDQPLLGGKESLVEALRAQTNEMADSVDNDCATISTAPATGE